MKGFISEDHFDHAHYTRLWTKRLEEMDVRVSTAVAEPALVMTWVGFRWTSVLSLQWKRTTTTRR